VKRWSLDWDDVTRTFGMSTASTIVHSKPYNRKNQLRDYDVILIHNETKVSVSEILGPARHTKKEWNQLIEDAYQKLFPLLEKKVAQHLRLPGW